MARQMKDSGIEWIGEIPSHWQRVKTLFALEMPITDGPHETPELFDEGIPFVSAEAVSCGNGSIDFDHIRGYISEEYYIECCKKYIPALNDILMIKSGATTGKVAVVNTDRVFTIWSPLAVFRFNPLVGDYQYMFYYLQSDAYQKQIENKWTFGTQQNIGMRTLEQLSLCLPPLAEQQRISDFLDRKCAEIDAVIERTKVTIEEYKKLKQAVITEAVTKGVRGARKMKDSGIEWIGEIPEEWDSSKLGGVTLSMRNGYVGPTRDLFFEAGIRYIQSLHIKDGVIDFGKHPYYVAEEWANEHPKVHTNDILIVQTGDIGQVGIVESEYDGCNCHALIIATPDCTLLFPRYLMFYLMSIPGKELLLSYKTGALLPHLNAGKIKFTPVLLPALDEQEEIVFYLDEKCAALDTLIAKKTALLTELEIYKKSLIYEYVTGKKEV